MQKLDGSGEGSQQGSFSNNADEIGTLLAKGCHRGQKQKVWSFGSESNWWPDITQKYFSDAGSRSPTTTPNS